MPLACLLPWRHQLAGAGQQRRIATGPHRTMQAQCQFLRQRHHVYMTLDGRISLAGLPGAPAVGSRAHAPPAVPSAPGHMPCHPSTPPTRPVQGRGASTWPRQSRMRSRAAQHDVHAAVTHCLAAAHTLYPFRPSPLADCLSLADCLWSFQNMQYSVVVCTTGDMGGGGCAALDERAPHLAGLLRAQQQHGHRRQADPRRQLRFVEVTLPQRQAAERRQHQQQQQGRLQGRRGRGEGGQRGLFRAGGGGSPRAPSRPTHAHCPPARTCVLRHSQSRR